MISHDSPLHHCINTDMSTKCMVTRFNFERRAMRRTEETCLTEETFCDVTCSCPSRHGFQLYISYPCEIDAMCPWYEASPPSIACGHIATHAKHAKPSEQEGHPCSYTRSNRAQQHAMQIHIQWDGVPQRLQKPYN